MESLHGGAGRVPPTCPPASDPAPRADADKTAGVPLSGETPAVFFCYFGRKPPSAAYLSAEMTSGSACNSAWMSCSVVSLDRETRMEPSISRGSRRIASST